MNADLSREALELAHCWLDHDLVKGAPELTEFRRRARYHQAQWREANGHPIGTHRVRPGTSPRLIGSQLDFDYALDTGATFLNQRALDAARKRAGVVEPHQIFDKRGFWADLLSSGAMAVNLFADLAADLERADRAVAAWWPDAPGRVVDVRFAHSPGRLDPSYSNSRRFFDAMFVLALPDGSAGAIAIDVNHREVMDRKGVKASHMQRFTEIHDRSGAFQPDTAAELARSRCSVMWLEHLLLLSMLQHATERWTWGRYVVVHPAANTDVADAVTDYRGRLDDSTTFASATIEELLRGDALSRRTVSALRRRYDL